MVSRKLMGVWAVLDFLLLAAGAVTIALSIVWRAPNTLMNMVLSPADLTGAPSLLFSKTCRLSNSQRIAPAGIILGIALLITFALSVGAIVQKSHVTVGLVILNYALLIDAIGIVVIGTFVWFFTLKERANFHVLWLEATRETRIKLQDQVCCYTSLVVLSIVYSCAHSLAAVAISTALTKLKLVAPFVKVRNSFPGWLPMLPQTFVSHLSQASRT